MGKASRLWNSQKSPQSAMCQQTLETATGFRPNRFQLIKIGYEYEHYSVGAEHNDNTLAIQFITTLHRSVGRE